MSAGDEESLAPAAANDDAERPSTAERPPTASEVVAPALGRLSELLRRGLPVVALAILAAVLLYPPHAAESIAIDLEVSGGDLLAGFSPGEAAHDGTPSFTWAAAETARFRAPVERRRDRAILVDGWPPVAEYPEPQRVDVLVNGTFVGSLRIGPSNRRCGVVAPAHVWREEDNIVELQFAYTLMPKDYIPDNDDDRTLAVALHEIRIVSLDP